MLYMPSIVCSRLYVKGHMENGTQIHTQNRLAYIKLKHYNLHDV